MDWSETLLFKLFAQCPKQEQFILFLKGSYEGIYTDVELGYHEDICGHESQTASQIERDTLVVLHYNKTLHTLRVLMHLLGLRIQF